MRSTAVLPNIRRVLLATDFSETSEGALEFALGLCRQLGAKLYVAHVVPRPRGHVAVPETVAMNPHMFALEQLEHLISSGRCQGVQFECLLAHGDIVQSILRIAYERAADLIVIGTHRHSSAAKLMFGSVADALFRDASCPVLTVSPAAARQCSGGLRVILAGADLVAFEDVAVGYAAKMAAAIGAQLIIAFVGDHGYELRQGERTEHEIAYLEQRLLSLVPAGVELAVPARAEIRFGDVSTELLGIARANAVDLIVVGAHTATWAARIPRTVAYTVASNAPCPVLTVGPYASATTVTDSEDAKVKVMVS